MTEDNLSEPFITEKEAAAILLRSPVSLQRWRRMKKAPPHYIVNGKPYYRRSEILRWMTAKVMGTLAA